MDLIHIGPTILSVIAWGCSLNIIVAPWVAEKNDWAVDEIVFSQRFRTSGKIGMAISMILAVLSAGWWGMLIIPAGGMLFGGISTAILEDAMIGWSAPIGMLASLICGVWLIFAF